MRREPLYCRWPDGTFSVVQATNREDAELRLDEFGQADRGQIGELRNFMADFDLTPAGLIQLSRGGEGIGGLGEEAWDEIMSLCYEDFAKHTQECECDPETTEHDALLRAAVEAERERDLKIPIRLPRSRRARALQKQISGLSASVADRYAREAEIDELPYTEVGACEKCAHQSCEVAQKYRVKLRYRQIDHHEGCEEDANCEGSRHYQLTLLSPRGEFRYHESSDEEPNLPAAIELASTDFGPPAEWGEGRDWPWRVTGWMRVVGEEGVREISALEWSDS